MKTQNPKEVNYCAVCFVMLMTFKYIIEYPVVDLKKRRIERERLTVKTMTRKERRKKERSSNDFARFEF